MNTKLVHVAVAILYRNGKYLMQLRDNIPTIVYPGFWAFFGGHIEPDEPPEIAVKRELKEEIGYVPPVLHHFRNYEDPNVVRHVFHGQLTVELKDLVLGEGWDMGLLTVADIQRGNCYSEIAGEVRPLGDRHQRILLDFVESQIGIIQNQ
ncbi:NUDIX hydrolase [Floridanema aerugineum]|uniref:NUDIX domain-containing protein n=1 Tax=Floridaenema aerugineum BLCC-F46 TaxID=3153654 RepID=A0ABV4X672_9CYAN